MNILFHANKMNAHNALNYNNIINNVHHYLKVNIPGLSSFRVLPGTWGGYAPPFLPPYLYPPTPPPINDPYKSTIPQVSEKFFW
jgi:hypothetical protein